MVTTLYLVRHGETEGSRQMRYKGSIDVPMSEKGFEQIRSTSAFIQDQLKEASYAKYAKYLYDIQSSAEKNKSLPAQGNLKAPENEIIRLNAVYTSGLSRAATGAKIIAALYGLKPVVLHDLRERHFGIWEGMSFLEIREKYPETFNAWAEDPLLYSPPEGESTIEVRDRVINVLDSILSRHPDEHIAVVAHGGVNRIILCHVLGIPLENIFRIEQDYGGLNIIEFWDKYPVVKLINGTKK
ncbi:MAG: hypothetical protein A2X59_01790 [Nitrospirae bacterium GWC2_42_7]|nr:MAG: hypothetical protein A2X59_01790 [Nitrospirae bacterium GWC2_42_7]